MSVNEIDPTSGALVSKAVSGEWSGIEEPFAFFIPYPVKSGNRHNRVHWAVSRKHAAVCRETMFLTALAGKRPPVPLKSFGLVVHCTGSQLIDPDNLARGFKPYLDGLKDAGVIYDDSPKYMKRYFYGSEKTTSKKLHSTWVWVFPIQQKEEKK